MKEDYLNGNIPLPQSTQVEIDRLLLPASDFVESWIEEVAATANRTITPTGFERLDDALDGGLWEGLYAVGALSSLGKTTYLLQMADQIAKHGRPVMIISLEMSKNELIAKSVSRLTFIQDSHRAFTVRELMNAKTWALAEANTKKAITEYQETAKNIYILEGNHRTNTGHIEEVVDSFIRAYSTYPVVIIDYLQILALTDEKGKDPRTSVDNVVWDLKTLSRKYKVPVIVVSSFNRESYSKPADVGSFKESGGIEYTSDVVIGLQFKGVGTENFNLDEARTKTPREVELVILKNRNGRIGDKISYYYHSAYNFYKEMKREHETQAEQPKRNTFTPKQAKITRR